jgi:hypothetical protein
MITAAADSMNLRQTLDRLERAVVVSLFLFLVYRFAGAVAQTPLDTIYLVTEGVVMLMVLCRRSTERISVSPKDWPVAFAGTFLSMASRYGVGSTLRLDYVEHLVGPFRRERSPETRAPELQSQIR